VGYGGFAAGSRIKIGSVFTTTVHHTGADSEMGRQNDLKASDLRITLGITNPVYRRDVTVLKRYSARSYQMGPWECRYGESNSYKRCTYPTGIIYYFNGPFVNIPLEIGYETYGAIVYRLCVSGKGCGREGHEVRSWFDMTPFYMDVLPADPQGVVNWSELGRSDADFDGISDQSESYACRYTADCDNDGLSDAFERSRGTSCWYADTDGDGLSDYWELRLNLDPRDPDTDGDGLQDGDEWVHWSDGRVTGAWTFAVGGQDYRAWPNPLEPDADDDMLPDEMEKGYSTNPNAWDPGGILKWAVPEHAVRAGDVVTFSLYYENRNAALRAITDLYITDTLPAAYLNPAHTVQSDVPLTTARDGNTYVWTTDALSTGQAINITVVGQVDPGIVDTQYITNVVQASSTYLGEIHQRQTRHPVLVDMDPPSSEIVGPVDGAIFSRQFVTETILWGRAEDLSSSVVSVEYDDGSGWKDVALEGSGKRLTWQTVWPIPTTDAYYTLGSKAVDIAGNTETPGAGAQVLVDSTPPTSAITNLYDGQALTATVVIPDPINAPYRLDEAYTDVKGLAWDALGGVAEVHLLANWSWLKATGTTNWTTRWYLSKGLPRFEGDYRLASRATDVANNLEDPYTVITVTVDNTPPTAEYVDFQDPSSPLSPVISTTRVLTGYAVDVEPMFPKAGTTDERAGIERMELCLNGGAWVPADVQSLPPRGITATWAYTWTPTADGVYTLTMRATDRAGNASDVITHTNPIFADVTPPTATITSHSDGQIVKAPIQTLEGEARDGMTGVEWVQVSTDGGSTWQPAVLRGERWFYDWEPAADGDHNQRVRAIDGVGNVGTDVGITVTVDTCGPMAIIVTPRNGDVISTTTVVTGSARAHNDALTHVNLYVNGVPDATTLITSTPESGTWTYSWSPGADHVYTLAAEAHIVSGIPQSVTDTQVITVTVDGTPPDLTPGAGLPVSVFTDTQIVITGTVSDTGSGVRSVEVLTDTGGTWQPAVVANGVWTYTWELGYLDNVIYAVSQRATDKASNVISQVLGSLTADNLPPSSPTIVTLSHEVGQWYDIGTGTPPNLLLSASWSGASDGAGLEGYAATWNTDPTTRLDSTAMQPPDQTTAAQSVDRPGIYYFHLRTGDNSGNWSYTSHYGPIHVGGRETYGYALIDGALMTNEWFTSTHRLGVDPRPDTPQELYATWDDESLYLVWRGANWDAEGELWVFLDSGTGGSKQTGLSGIPQLPFQADYAYQVADRFASDLWHYSGGQWITTTTGPTTTFVLRNDLTEIRSALADVGLVGKNEVRLVAFATGSPVWAIFPSTNPLDGAWTDAYHWMNFGDRFVTPNMKDLSEPQPQGLDLQLALLDAPGDALAPGAAVTLTYVYTNSAVIGLAAMPARILVAMPDGLIDVGFEATHAFYPATPPWPGESRWEVQLTDSKTSPSLSAGKTGVLIMRATVSTTLTQSAILTMSAEITGSTGTRPTPYPDAAPADNVVDVSVMADATPPEIDFGELTSSHALAGQAAALAGNTYVGGSTQVLLGTANDDLSGVSKVQVDTGDVVWREASGRSLWYHEWTVTGNDGDIVTFRARATDGLGNTSSPAQLVATVDLTSPSSQIVVPASDKLAWSPYVLITGTVADTGSGVGVVEVSTDDGQTWDEVDYVSGGAWGYLWALTEEMTGTYRLRSRATDFVGNVELPKDPVVVEIRESLATTIYLPTIMKGYRPYED